MPTAAEIQTHFLLRVEQDVEFRKRLIDDPKTTIEAETGQELPDEVFVFVQETIAKAQQAGSSVDTPLTEDELIQVMGGSDGCVFSWGRDCLLGPNTFGFPQST